MNRACVRASDTCFPSKTWTRSSSPELVKAVETTDELFQEVLRQHVALLAMQTECDLKCVGPDGLNESRVSIDCMSAAAVLPHQLSKPEALLPEAQALSQRDSCLDHLERIQCQKLEYRLSKIDEWRRRRGMLPLLPQEHLEQHQTSDERCAKEDADSCPSSSSSSGFGLRCILCGANGDNTANHGARPCVLCGATPMIRNTERRVSHP